MPSWGNTDSIYDKPHFPQERQVRPFITLTTNGTVNSGNTIVFTGTGALTAANLGIVAGMSAYSANLSISGEQEFFVSNNTVKSVTGNNVVFNTNVFGSIPSGTNIDFAYVIQNNQDSANTYFSDTVLVSQTRLANASFGEATNHATAHQGWVHVTTGTGGRAGRVQAEVLVALANTAVANTGSGYTSNSTAYYTGL
jgi:hypothetical protein